jgi:hypothetical protein
MDTVLSCFRLFGQRRQLKLHPLHVLGEGSDELLLQWIVLKNNPAHHIIHNIVLALKEAGGYPVKQPVHVPTSGAQGWAQRPGAERPYLSLPIAFGLDRELPILTHQLHSYLDPLLQDKVLLPHFHPQSTRHPHLMAILWALLALDQLRLSYLLPQCPVHSPPLFHP